MKQWSQCTLMYTCYSLIVPCYMAKIFTHMGISLHICPQIAKHFCVKRIKGDTLVPLIASQAALVAWIERPEVLVGGGKTEPPQNLALLGSWHQARLGRHFGSRLAFITTCSIRAEQSSCRRGDLPAPATSVSILQLSRQWKRDLT